LKLVHAMRSRFYCLFIVCLHFVPGASSQLTGKVFRKGSTEVLSGVNVKNSTTKKYNTSDLGGNYIVPAQPGDTVIFSSAGYHADTLIASKAFFARGYDVYLAVNVVVLAAVEIDPLGKYLADSIRRREEYAFILDKKHPVKLMNEKRAADAPGFNFSPVGFFSKREKEKRRLKQRLKDEEERDRQAYIDARFPRARIARLTMLSGDSLNSFISLYRPSFNFCRNSSNQDMLLYINDKLLLFRESKKALKTKQH